jgi:uncharacterized protein
VKLEGEGKLVRIFIGESDKHGRKPLCQAIVEMLREVADRAERIEAIMPKLDEMVSEGLVTLERVEVVACRAQADED